MRNPLRHLFRSSDAPASDAGEPPSLQVAACAILLEARVGRRRVRAVRTRRPEQALARHFGLAPEAQAALIAEAERRRKAAIDDFALTQEIVRGYDLGQKMVLAEVMWSIVLADGTVVDREAYLLRKLANLLDLEPAYLSQARRRAADARSEQ